MSGQGKHSVKEDQESNNSDLRAVLSMVPVPYLLIDGSSNIRSMAPEAAKLLGISEANVGMRVGKLRLPPDIPDLKDLISHVLRLGVHHEQEVLGCDGHWYSMRISPSSSGDQQTGGVAVAFVDIHALKQSQEALKSENEATVRALLETASQAILAVRGDERIVLVNAAAEKMFGYARHEFREMKLETLIPTRLRKHHAQYHTAWRVQPENRPMGLGRDLVALRKDGSEFPVEVTLSHVRANGDMLAIAFVSDISNRKKSERALLQYQRELQELTARLLSVQEAETKILARELHDVFSQKLAALGMHISALLKTAVDSSDTLPEKLKTLGKEVNGLAEDIHRMSRRLHPAILDDLGLEAALREECDGFSQHTGIPIHFRATAVPRQLPDEIALCLYRVAQESLRNIGKHARAKEVRILLSCDRNAVILSIEDVGDGFDLADVRGKGGLGLVSMEERARLVNGVFNVQSKRGIGTRVELRVPRVRKANHETVEGAPS